jgi:ubiquinone/menaquinone biosynthesis C-methylase UbiE
MSETSSVRQDPLVAQQYDNWARVYDRFWGRYIDKTLSVLLEQAAVQPGERVLDLACGTGELERRLVASVPEAGGVGMDVAPMMIEQARAKLDDQPSFSFLQGDVHELPLDDSSFDVVVSASSLHYFTHPMAVLREATRVLRPSGRFVVLDWCRDYWTCRLMDALLRRVDPAHHRCYSLAEVTSLLGAAGLHVHSAFRYRFDVEWGMMVVEEAKKPPAYG